MTDKFMVFIFGKEEHIKTIVALGRTFVRLVLSYGFIIKRIIFLLFTDKISKIKRKMLCFCFDHENYYL